MYLLNNPIPLLDNMFAYQWIGIRMNKQIEKLALECGAWHQVYGNRNFMLDEHFDIAKFARLIVLKCAEIADTAEPFLASDLIKEHFGAES